MRNLFSLASVQPHNSPAKKKRVRKQVRPIHRPGPGLARADGPDARLALTVRLYWNGGTFLERSEARRSRGGVRRRFGFERLITPCHASTKEEPPSLPWTHSVTRPRYTDITPTVKGRLANPAHSSATPRCPSRTVSGGSWRRRHDLAGTSPPSGHPRDQGRSSLRNNVGSKPRWLLLQRATTR